MSILIKGMEMPEGCGECPLAEGRVMMDELVLICRINGNEYSKSHGVCPLVSVPPCGRLIDVAALWVEIDKICDRRDAGIISDLTCLQQLLSVVRHAPTIIPAEEGE